MLRCTSRICGGAGSPGFLTLSMGTKDQRDRTSRLAAQLTHCGDDALSKRWAELLGPLLGVTPQQLLADQDPDSSNAQRDEIDILRIENATLRARIEVLLRTVQDLSRK
jgi:hypothetical protein